MDEREWLLRRFQEHRPRLRAVAYRMLGSTSEAEDAVQEAWIRLSHSNAGTIWPVVHQWLGVRPDLGRGSLEIVP
jgi:DNA-directed RNA polymerase specialized sigma24 family protein